MIKRLFSLLLIILALRVYPEEDLVEQKKVVFVTIPKAGTHLLLKALVKIGKVGPEWIQERAFHANNLEAALTESKSSIFLTHLFPGAQSIRSLDSKKFTKVLLIRDPRDVIVSFVFHLLNKKQWPFFKRFNFSHFFHLSFDAQIVAAIQAPSFSPTEALLNATSWMKDPDLLILRFEDLVGSPGGGSDEAQTLTLQTIAQCIGKNLTESELNEITKDLFGKTRTFREGKIGAWKNAYGEGSKAFFKMILGQTVIDLGYGSEDW